MSIVFTHQLDEINREENPLESIVNTIAFSSADWGMERDRAWLYGIVMGWDDDDDPDEESAMPEIATRCGWSDAQVERLRRLHASFELLRSSYEVTS